MSGYYPYDGHFYPEQQCMAWQSQPFNMYPMQNHTALSDRQGQPYQGQVPNCGPYYPQQPGMTWQSQLLNMNQMQNFILPFHNQNHPVGGRQMNPGQLCQQPQSMVCQTQSHSFANRTCEEVFGKQVRAELQNRLQISLKKTEITKTEIEKLRSEMMRKQLDLQQYQQQSQSTQQDLLLDDAQLFEKYRSAVSTAVAAVPEEKPDVSDTSEEEISKLKLKIEKMEATMNS